MGDPHRKERYGEVWPQYRLDAYLEEMEHLRDVATLSGGWAWHFLAPEGHTELKHGHDHKDLDLYVDPSQLWLIIEKLIERNFERKGTKYDSNEFMRYQKTLKPKGEKPFKMVIDLFVAEVPKREVKGGWSVVEPVTLLSFYTQGHHGSSESFAVQAARKLLDQDIDPEDRPELVEIPEE